MRLHKQIKYIVKCCDIHKSQYTESKVSVYAYTSKQAEIKFRNTFKDFDLISITPFKNNGLRIWLNYLL